MWQLMSTTLLNFAVAFITLELTATGDIAEGYYQLDGLWYPTVVEHMEQTPAGPVYMVRFVGFGNEDKVPESWLRWVGG